MRLEAIQITRAVSADKQTPDQKSGASEEPYEMEEVPEVPEEEPASLASEATVVSPPTQQDEEDGPVAAKETAAEEAPLALPKQQAAEAPGAEEEEEEEVPAATKAQPPASKAPAAEAKKPEKKPVAVAKEGEGGSLERALATLKKDPAHLASLRLVVEQWEQEGRWEELIEQLERSVRYLSKKEGEQEMMLKLAMIQWEQQNMERADYYFKRLRHKDPDLEPMLRFYEQFYLEQKDWRQLLRHLGQRLEKASEQEEQRELTERLARIALEEMESPDEAIKAWRAYVDLYPEDEGARETLRHLYKDHGKWPLYVSYLQEELERLRGLEADTDAAQISLLEEVSSVYRDHIPGGERNHIQALKDLLALSPYHEAAFEELKSLYMGSRHHSKELTTMLSERAESAIVGEDHGLAIALLEELANLWEVEFNNTKNALPFLQRILQVDPTHTATRDRLVEIYKNRPDYKALFELLSAETDSLSGEALEAHLRELLAIALENLRARDLAIPLLEQLIEMQPEDVELYTKLDMLLRHQKDWSALADLLQKKAGLPGLSGDEVILAYKEAASLVEGKVEGDERQKKARAAKLWKRILELEPENATAFSRLSDLLIEGREFDQLVELYAQRDALDRYFMTLESLVEKTEGDEEKALVYRHMATLAEQELGDLPRAVRSLESLLAVSGEPEAVAGELITKYRTLGQLDREIEMNVFLLERAPDDQARYERLITLADLEIEREGTDEQAFQWQLKAIALRPEDTEAVQRAEELATHLEQLPTFVDHLEALAAQEGIDDALRRRLWHRMARLARDEFDDNVQAIELFERLHQEEPESVQWLEALEALYEDAVYPEKRIAALQKLIEALRAAGAGEQVVVSQLAKIADVQHKSLGQTAEAQATYERLLALDEEFVPAIRGLRTIATQQGQTERVVELLEREFELITPGDMPARQAVRFELARVSRDEQGEPSQALLYYREMLTDEPDNEAALLSVEELLGAGEVTREAALLIEPIFRATGAPERLARALVARLSHTDEPAERQDILAELVPLYADQMGDMEAALPYAINRFQLDPSNPQRWQELERFAQALGRWEEVIAQFVSRSPLAGPDHEERAELLRLVATHREAHLDDAPGALEAWEALFAFAPTDLNVIEALERLYRAQSKPESLVYVLEQKAELVGGAEQVSLLLEAAMLQDEVLSEPDRAIEIYRRVLEVSSTHADAVKALERLLRQQQRFVDLDELLTRQAGLAQDAQVRRNFQLQQAALRTQQLGDALGAFGLLRELIAEDPEDPRAIMLMVTLDESLAKRDKHAPERLDIALELDRLYRAQQNYPKLVEILETRLSFAQDSFDKIALLDELSDLYLRRLGEPAKAFERTRQAVILSPEDLERRGRLEEMAEALDGIDQVVSAYEQATRDADDYVVLPLLKRSGQLLFERLGQAEEAIPFYERALGLEETDLESLRALETLYMQVSRADALAENLRAQAQLVGGEARVGLLRRIGELEEQVLGRPERAIEAWRMMSEAQPDAVEALEALERLYASEQQWIELSEVLRRKVTLLEGETARLQTLLKLARLYSKELDDSIEAIESYKQMLRIAPDHDVALDALDALYRSVENWVDLGEVLRQKLSLVSPEQEEQRTGLELRLAKVLSKELGQVDQALDLYLEIFERHPGQPQARQALEEFVQDVAYVERCAPALIAYYEHAALWHELVQLYTLLRAHHVDPLKQAQTDHIIAQIERDQVGNLEAGFRAMASAWTLAPRQEDWRGELVAMSDVLGNWEQLAEVYEQVVEKVMDAQALKARRVELAHLYRDKIEGRQPEAEVQFLRALDLDERDLTLYASLQQLYTQAQRWQDIVDLLERRYSVFMPEPDSYTLLLLQAQVYDEFLRDELGAVEAYRRVLSVEPAEPTAPVAINRLLRAQQNYQDLADFLENRLHLVHEQAEQIALRRELATLYASELDQPQRALELWQQILGMQPFDPEAIQALEQLYSEFEGVRVYVAEILEPIYREQQSYPKLLSLLRARSEQEPDPFSRAEILREMARINEEELRDWRAALTTQGQLFELVPEEESVWAAMERLGERLGSWEHVIALYEHVLEHNYTMTDPTRSDLLCTLGLMREERQGALESARDEYLKVLEIDPANTRAFDALDRLLMRLGDFGALAQLYRSRAASHVDPTESIRWLDKLATLQDVLMEDEAAAIETYRQMLEINLTHQPAYRALERLFKSSKRFEDLAELYRQMAEMTDDPEQRLITRQNLAQLLETELDQVDEALVMYRELLAERPGHPDVMRALDGMRRDLATREGEWMMHQQQIADLLLENYQPERDWRRIVEMLVLKESVSEDPFERIELLGRAAETVRARSTDYTESMQALALRTRAWRVDPLNRDSFAKLEALADELGAGAWERVIPQVLEALEDTELGNEQSQLLNAVASVYMHKLDDPDSALIAYEQAVEVDPEDEEANRALESLYMEYRLWDALAKLLKGRLEHTFDEQSRLNLLQRIADLYQETRPDEPEAAIEVYTELRRMDPSAISYLNKLTALYDLTGQNEELVDTLSQKVELLSDDAARLGVLKQMAQVQHEILGLQEDAIDTYRRILFLDAEDEFSIRALASLYQANQSWVDLLEMLVRQREFSGGVQEINQVDLRRAQIMLDHTDQPGEALELLRAVASRSEDWQAPVEMMEELLQMPEIDREAFEALESLHLEAGRWEQLSELYEKRLGRLEDPFLRLEILTKLAALQHDQMQSPDRALMTLGRAFHEVPTDPTVRQRLEQLAGALGAQQELVAIYEDALEAGIEDDIARTYVHTQLGQAYATLLENPTEAIRHMEAVIALDEYNEMALGVLDQLYLKEKQWQKLGEIVSRKINVVAPQQVAAERYKLGYLHEHEFGDPRSAMEQYRQVLVDEPEHRGAIEALERMITNEELQAEIFELLEQAYTQTDAWERLAQLLRYKVEQMEPGTGLERAALLRRVAQLEEEHLGRPDQAVQFYSQALEEDPLDLHTQERLEALSAELGALPYLVEIYERIIDQLDDPIRKGELASRAAEWAKSSEDRGPERAQRLYMIAMEAEPHNMHVLEQLEAIARLRQDEGALRQALIKRLDLVFDRQPRFDILFELSGLHASAGDMTEAIEALREATGIEPEHEEAALELAQLYRRAERWDDLVEQLEHMSGRLPPAQRLEVCKQLGALYLEKIDQPQQAIHAYSRALELDPQNLELLRKLEEIYASEGLLDSLDEVLDRQMAVATEPKDLVRVMVRRAQIAYDHHHDTPGAIAKYEEAYTLDPTSELITASLDELYRKEGLDEELFKLYYRQLEHSQDPQRRAELSLEMARLGRGSLGQIDVALQYLDFALQNVPGYVPALEEKEEIYMELGDYGQVSVILGERLAGASDPKEQVAVLMRRASFLDQALGQTRDAIDDYVAVLNHQPDHLEAYEHLVKLLHQEQAWEQLYEVMGFKASLLPEAERKSMYLEMAQVAQNMDQVGRRIDALDAAYKLDPEDLDVVGPLLDATIANHDFARAEPLLENVIASLTEKRRMKEVVQFYHLRGKLAAQQGRLDDAREAYESARRIDATYVPNLLSLGHILYQQEDWDGAMKVFQSLLLHQMSIKDNATKVDMYYHLGQLRIKAGESQMRIADMFKRALNIDPEHEPSRQALESL